MKNKKIFCRKGISAIVGTVLLIVFVISLGLIVVNWSGKLVSSGIEKSGNKIGTNLECSDVNLRLEGGENENILVKNNNKESIKGFIGRLITENNAFVDYKNANKEIAGFGVATISYSGDYEIINEDGQLSGNKVNYNDVKTIEIIPRILVEDNLVNCEMKRVKWKKV